MKVGALSLHYPMQEDYLERIERSEMTYYREVYKDSKRWSGEPIEGKTLIIYCEQGLGDTIQFARYFDVKGANIILHCPKSLHRLLLSSHENCMWGAIDKDDPHLPPHDYHVLSMSLPFILKDIQVIFPYINASPASLGDVDNVKKIGICWEGNPDHPNNSERSCPLRYFKALAKPDRKLFMLQKEIHNRDLIKGCDDLDLYSMKIDDMADLAGFIAAMDVVVSVDTAALHLAGAMGKMTFGLLAKDYDYRWKVRNWYPTAAMLFQGKKGDWLPVFAGVMMLLDTILEGKEPAQPKEIAKMIGESFVSSN